MRLLSLLLLGVLAVGLTSCGTSSDAQLAPILERMGLVAFQKTPMAPDIRLNTVQGEAVKLSDLRGKTVVVHFWTTWSAPSKREWPSLVALHQALAGHPNVVLLAVDLSEPYGVVRAFLSDHPAPFPVLLDVDGVTGNGWGIQDLPTTVVVDKAGRLVGGATGVVAWDGPEVAGGLLALAALK